MEETYKKGFWILKKMLSLLMIVMLAAAISACDNKTTDSDVPSEQPSPLQSPQPGESMSPQEAENIATLCVDFSGGSPDPEIFTYELGYSGELTPEILLDGLTALTGLSFIADVQQGQMGMGVDWKSESTLIDDLAGHVEMEGYEFYDAETMRWFMMDSLYRTLLENFNEDTIFYTMEGGNELSFDELYPVKVFPSNIPYQGSPFYFAHADTQGHITDENEAAEYLSDALEESGIDLTATSLVHDPDAGDPWFGDMAVWYFTCTEKASNPQASEMYLAVTYDWEIWEFDENSEDWILWE